MYEYDLQLTIFQTRPKDYEFSFEIILCPKSVNHLNHLNQITVPINNRAKMIDQFERGTEGAGGDGLGSFKLYNCCISSTVKALL